MCLFLHVYLHVGHRLLHELAELLANGRGRRRDRCVVVLLRVLGGELRGRPLLRGLLQKAQSLAAGRYSVGERACTYRWIRGCCS